MINKYSFASYAVLCALLPAAASAEDGAPVPAGLLSEFEHEHHGDGTPKSWLAAELVLEWQNEYRNDSDDATIDDTNNSFVRAELAPIIHLTDEIFIDGVLVFEPFDQASTLNANDSIWFDREGAFAEEFKINYDNGTYAFWAGKFNPGFGMAWDFGRGIWSEDFAEDYEITEKIGGGASYTFETESQGAHTLSATTFFADTTWLAEGVITDRNRNRLKDGGASNTEDFSSFTVSLDGENLAGVENLIYHLGYRFLGEQDSGQSATTDDETGVAATLGYVFPVTEDVTFDVLAEYAGLRNFGGVTNSDRDYYTASVIATIFENWNITGGYTKRDIDNDGSGVGYNDHLLQLSGGYDFGNGLTAEVGWRNSEEMNMDTDILGFLFRYTKEF